MKRDEEEERLQQKVLAVHQKEQAHWTVGDIQVMVSWFKRPGDSKMPMTKELLKQRYDQTKNRSKHDRTYLKSSEAPIIDPQANANDEQNAGGELNDGSLISLLCFNWQGVHAL